MKFLKALTILLGKHWRLELIAAELIAAFEEFAARAEEEYEKLQKEEEAPAEESAPRLTRCNPITSPSIVNLRFKIWLTIEGFCCNMRPKKG